MKANCRIVVLFSGGGSNLQALLDKTKGKNSHGEVVAVLTNRPNAKGIKRAEIAGIPSIMIDHTTFDSRKAFDQAMIQELDQYKPDLVVLAGFMRILSDEFVAHYEGKLINIHPSRLPLYKGLNTHQRAIEAGDEFHGASVHFVTAELDAGTVILQSKLKIKPEHTPETLAQDLLVQEHELYPTVVAWICEGKIKYNEGVALFEGKALQQPLQLN